MAIKIKMSPLEFAMWQKQSRKRRGIEDSQEDMRNKELLRLGAETKHEEEQVVEEPILGNCTILMNEEPINEVKEKTVAELTAENEELKRTIAQIQEDIVHITNEQIKFLMLEAITSEDLPTEEI